MITYLSLFCQLGQEQDARIGIPGVVGSNPTGPSTFLPYLMQSANLAVFLTRGFPLRPSLLSWLTVAERR